MQIHWFSPLPPSDTPAAAYTAELAPELARKAALVFWTTQKVWDPAMKRYGRVRRHSMRRFPWRAVHRGDIAIFHLGREPEHFLDIWQLLEAHSGIAVLHDGRLHDLFAQSPGYLENCARMHGETGRLAGEVFRGALCSGERMAASFPMLELVREVSSGILAHDPAVARGLERGPGPPVAYFPNPLSGGDAPGCARALLDLAEIASSRYACAMKMGQRMAQATKGFGSAAMREAVLDRGGAAVGSLSATRPDVPGPGARNRERQAAE